MTFQKKRAFHIGGASCLMLSAIGGGAMAQNAAPAPSSSTALPEITETAPRVAQQPRRPRKRVVSVQRRETPVAEPQSEAQILAGKNDKLDQVRQNIVAPIGANS